MQTNGVSLHDNKTNLGGEMDAILNETEMPWAILKLGQQLLAGSTHLVREIQYIPKTIRLPQALSFVRGLINLRGDVMPLIDLRVRLGMNTAQAELDAWLETMTMRKHDHEQWLNELKESVKQNRAFEGELDPHKCAFGRWYDQFTTDDIYLKNIVKQFDAPHKTIHKLALEVEQSIEQGNQDKAIRMINDAEQGTLVELFKVFDEFHMYLKSSFKEVAVIVQQGGDSIAVTVDEVLAIEYLDGTKRTDVQDVYGQIKEMDLITGVGNRQKDDSLILFLDMAPLFKEVAGIASQIKSK
jgi:chemotaxis signal transduction protein